MFSVIFDMDGTLLDTQRICIPAWDYAGDKQSIEAMGSHIPYVCGMNELGWSSYLEDNFPGLDIITFKKDMREYININLKVKFMKGAPELMKFLKNKNIKMALASGSSMGSIVHHLTEVDALDSFDVIVSGKEVEHGKPAPDIFLLTAERLGVPPEECFVFEDSANGVKAAHAAGMKCIGIPDVVEFSEDVKKLMFAELSSLDEAIEVFKKELKGMVLS